MLRPALSALCDITREPASAPVRDASIQSDMRHSMLLKAANVCVSVAQELFQLIVESVDSSQDFLPAPWYTVFCKYCTHAPHNMD